MILTGQTRFYPEARLNQIVGDIALGRLGLPLEVAKIALFLGFGGHRLRHRPRHCLRWRLDSEVIDGGWIG